MARCRGGTCPARAERVLDLCEVERRVERLRIEELCVGKLATRRRHPDVSAEVVPGLEEERGPVPGDALRVRDHLRRRAERRLALVVAVRIPVEGAGLPGAGQERDRVEDVHGEVPDRAAAGIGRGGQALE